VRDGVAGPERCLTCGCHTREACTKHTCAAIGRIQARQASCLRPNIPIGSACELYISRSSQQVCCCLQEDMLRFTSELIKFRRAHPCLGRDSFLG
jgi:hypothetical protein